MQKILKNYLEIRFSIYSEAFASELIDNPEELFLPCIVWYIFTYSTTQVENDSTL